LDALEAVVESWIEGITGDKSWTEGKVGPSLLIALDENTNGQDKAKKIIDIWRKYEIFPSATVDRLTARLASNTPIASGSRSTTPTYEPGGPPPISPALPPLDVKEDVPSASLAGMEKRNSGEGKWLFLICGSGFVSCRVSLHRPKVGSYQSSIQDLKFNRKIKKNSQSGKVILLDLLLTQVYYHYLTSISIQPTLVVRVDKACILALRYAT
jgi:hypothetical protein